MKIIQSITPMKNISVPNHSKYVIMFDTKKRKIIELESTIEEQQIQILRFDNCEEERKKLEKLIQEQQKIIKLALERIVPRKSEENQNLQFCMVFTINLKEG